MAKRLLGEDEMARLRSNTHVIDVRPSVIYFAADFKLSACGHRLRPFSYQKADAGCDGRGASGRTRNAFLPEQGGRAQAAHDTSAKSHGVTA